MSGSGEVSLEVSLADIRREADRCCFFCGVDSLHMKIESCQHHLLDASHQL